MSNRFSYVKYDEQAKIQQEAFKESFEKIEVMIMDLKEGRVKSLIFTYLEIAYMWTGKALRDEQIERNSQPDHVPERTNE